MTTSYLITGANRGLGFGFVTALAARDNVKIFATARDVSNATNLKSAADKYGNITILTWRADHAEDSAAIAAAIMEQDGALDVVIANAGIAKDATTVAQCNPSSIDFHMQANVAGNLHLFQAIYPLLEASTQPGGGVFMPISSQMGSIGDGPAFPNLAYGMSKAALNFMCKKIALEHEKIKVLIMHPGLVRTESARDSLAAVGLDIDAFNMPGVTLLTVEESVNHLLERLAGADAIKSGSFVSYDGAEIGW